MRVTICNWEKFNPRKDVQRASWFRVDHGIFEDPKFYSMDPIDWATFLYLCCHASKLSGSTFDINFEHAKRVAKLDKKIIERSIRKLEQLQFVLVDVTDTNADVTFTCLRNDTNDTIRNETNGDSLFDFEAIWGIYPRRVNKSDARDRFDRMIKTQTDFDALLVAVSNYASEQLRLETDERYIKHLASFLGTEKKASWRDWIDFTPPSKISSDLRVTSIEEVNRKFGGGVA